MRGNLAGGRVRVAEPVRAHRVAQADRCESEGEAVVFPMPRGPEERVDRCAVERGAELRARELRARGVLGRWARGAEARVWCTSGVKGGWLCRSSALSYTPSTGQRCHASTRRGGSAHPSSQPAASAKCATACMG